MDAAPHRIARQTWRVRAPSPAQAFALRRQLRTALDDELLPVLGRAFDALGLGDTVLRIPRLELRVAVRSGAGLPAALAEALADQLADVLPRRLAEARGETRVEANGATCTSSEAARRVEGEAWRRDALRHYLATGQLAWHAQGCPVDELVQLLRDEAGRLLADDPSWLDAVAGDVAQRHAAAMRWLQLLEPTSRAAIAARSRGPRVEAGDVATHMPAASVDALLAALEAQAPAGAIGEFLRPQVVAARIALPSHARARPPAPEVAALLDRIAAHAGLAPARHVANDGAQATSTVVKPPAATASADAIDVRRMPLAEALATSVATRSPDRAADESSTTAIDALHVRHAGLVLLHPFLPQLFRTLALHTADAPLSDASLPRAAALLHWLATGRDEVFEFELPLVKILLGLAPEAALAPCMALLSEADRAEADALLAAVVQHWCALGATSAGVLRNTFLDRPGLVRAAGRAWRLQVETHAFDVLLDRLPWGIALIKLPWMTRPIHTDWPSA